MGERSLAWRVGGTEASEVSEPKALGDTREKDTAKLAQVSLGLLVGSPGTVVRSAPCSTLCMPLHAALIEERPFKRSQLKVVLVLCKGISCVIKSF